MRGLLLDFVNLLQRVVALGGILAKALEIFGKVRIRFTLRRAGTLIPDNDIWIAASALQYGVPVITRDAHFRSVPGLLVERW